MKRKRVWSNIITLWLMGVAAPAQVPSITNAFTISSPTQLAEWQKRLTLGPGDVMNISIYEQPESVRANVTIGPDGRINYLQARDIMASGLTVDELRDHLESVLLKFYRPPLRVVVQPQSYNSKKYYMLGNVNAKGVFPLDRPITLLEAIARARGFASAAQGRNTLMLADLSRSFLIRRDPAGAFGRVPVDFEGLFLHGDLTQNVPLAPDDYLYFPPTDIRDVYVFGEVLSPGPIPYRPELSVMRALIARGSFTPRAYRARVLIVRGSLKTPTTIVVNTSDILSAKAVDIKLQPRDIVYVSRRPWYKAEELLERAVTAFMRAAIVAGVGQHVGPFINEPLFDLDDEEEDDN